MNKRAKRLTIPEVAKLNVGEYLTVKSENRNAVQCAYNHGYWVDKKFKVLKCLEGYRIWRVK